MKSIILATFICLLSPLGVNETFNIDQRPFEIGSITTLKHNIQSLFSRIDELSDEIKVTVSANVKAPSKALAKEQIKKKPVVIVEEKQSFPTKVNFRRFKSSFKELDKYWPTKNSNPINKKKVELKMAIHKAALPKPMRVKKESFSDVKLEMLDREFSMAVASMDDVIVIKSSATSEKSPIKISLLTMDIRNHLAATKLNVQPSIPKLAVEKIGLEQVNTHLAFLDEDDNIDRIIKEFREDKVRMASSSIEKPSRIKGDDLVFVSLNEEETKEVELSVDSQPEKLPEESLQASSIISDSVRQAISRSMNNVGNGKSAPLLASRGSVGSPIVRASGIPDFSKFIAAKPKKKGKKAKRMNFVTSHPEITIRPRLIDLKTKKNKSLFEFDVIPSFDLNDIIADAGDGFVKVEYPIKNDKGLFHGSIVHRDTVRLNVDLAVGSEINDYSIPIFEIEQFNDYLRDMDVSVPGGYLLVEYSENVESLDIEKYEKVIHLDQNFNQIKENEAPEYSLFVGVESGNNLLRILTSDGKLAEKIIFVYDDELTFTMTDFEKAQKIKIELYKENLLGKKSPLSVDSSNVNYFNMPIKSNRLALNKYEIESPPLIEGMRRYLEVKADGEVFVIGTDKGGALSVPTRKTLDLYLDQVDMENFENSCIIQVNSKRAIAELKIEGVTARGPMLLDTHFLNDDGQLYKVIDGVVRKSFITGDYQGSVYFHIKYEDGGEDISRSYCSPGTYVIENF